MPTLSIILIVRNEAHCLATCLDSVRAIADEIVVVDTGSTDTTLQVAEDFGARVGHFAWCDDFAAARNASIAMAGGGWLLHLDADEALDPENAAQIRALVDADGQGADAIEACLANYCEDPRAWRWVPATPGDPWARGQSGYIKTTLLRLFRAGRGFEYREAVHENITQSVIERGGVIASSSILIHHYGYDPGPERRAQKARLYYGIARKKAEAQPDDLKYLLDLAEQAFACGEPAEAEAACRRALAISPSDLGCGTMLANLLLNRAALDEARAVLEVLRAADYDAPHVYTALGAIACTQGRMAEARALLDHALALEPRAPMPRLYLARVYDREGRPDHALRALELVRDAFPTLPEPAQRVEAHRLRTQGEDFVRNGHTQPALECLIAALHRDAEDPLTHNALGVVLHALGDHTRARDSFSRALALAHGLPEAEENLRALGSQIPLNPPFSKGETGRESR